MSIKKTNKKASKKVATKSTGAKSGATKKTATKRIRKKQAFEKIPEERYFVLADGRRVDHYVTLANLLEEMEKDIIRHHVSDIHHDFANWIHDVFSEKDLAEKIRVVQDPDKIRLLIYKHIITKHLK